MKTKTARLENWRVVGSVLHGNIYDDSEGRFADGSPVRTSPMLPMSMQEHSPAEGVNIATRNTVYLLGKPLQEEIISSQYVDIMLDLETMGVGNNPAIIQIAAIAFNSETGEEYAKFDHKVDLQSSMDAGLTISAGTIKFWMTHESVNQETRYIVMEQTGDHGKQGATLEEVLKYFKTWYEYLPSLTKKKLGCAWGNGSASDNVWVRSAYEAVGEKPPFIFRDDLCLRTLRTLAKRKGYNSDNLHFEGNMHDGLDDCRYQIKDLIEIKKFLDI